MSNPNDGGCAFPCNSANLGTKGAYPADPGMSLRDYFAAAALQGMAAGNYWSDNFNNSKPEFLNSVAEVAYSAADAMLAARVQKDSK
jgi:hypothetical protein